MVLLFFANVFYTRVLSMNDNTMPPKRNYEAEKLLRRGDAKRRRFERVLTGYVQYIHPEIYSDARNYYDRLDAIYPEKKDLRKTPQFLTLKDGPTSHKPAKVVKVQQTVQKTVMDNFVLNIPLIQRRAEVHQKSTVVQETSTITSAPETSTSTIAQGTSTITSAPETSTATSASEMPALPPIDEASLEQIIRELQGDPNLQYYFDDLDDFDNCPLW